ncbi:ABC transporter ATP-binding protein [Candidatus Omnitrophota bacterium]
MIEIEKLYKSFSGFQVLDNLSLAIGPGETRVIIGRSGCGKSVLIKHIIGLLDPDAGSVKVDGKVVSELSQKELNDLRMKIGMLFQGSALFDSLNVEENVGFILYEYSKLSSQVIRQRVKEALSLVGLKDIGEKMPSELSGGMRKRVALARALCKRPQILLYDEPTSEVDPITADATNDLIKNLHDKLKITSIVVTHDMNSAFKIADKIVMLYRGRAIAEGSAEEIRNSKHPVVQQFITGASTGPITDAENIVMSDVLSWQEG